MKTKCTSQKLVDAIPKSRDKAASARDIANVNDWTINSVKEGIIDLLETLTNGELRLFEANKQDFYWIEGYKDESVKYTSRPGKPWSSVTWDDVIRLIPEGESNAKTIAEMWPGETKEWFYRKVSTARRHASDKGVEIKSACIGSGNSDYKYWKESIREDNARIEKMIMQVLRDTDVKEGRIVVERDGVTSTYEKVMQ